MKIQSIPMWVGSGNNYAYLITDDKTKDAIIVDPANPPEVEPHLDAAVKDGANLVAILNTHWHGDHSGGNDALKKKYSLPVWGWSNYGKPTVHRDRRFSEELPSSGTPEPRATFKIGEDINATVLYTPCHTQDAICYYLEDAKTGEKAVFTGDTLFIGGCGRFFEGTAEQMYPSLKKIRQLDEKTVVYPGHEYTKSNAAFAKSLVKDDAVDSLVAFCESNKVTTGKFTIGDEKKHNLFLRTDEPAVQRALGITGVSGREALQKLRETKDNA
ncbi:Metallo-hydrolase/oxidoreductase [Ascobolus immersus RN42]|uniref:hydroxyacylglutathione hydrolase n=1 Tax=Ascobolus immersus RN42 TaxID=1160509 RepID=A0A3N4I2Q4_ASCIM|nr:Metallo-hydrolase/oxidoreductase [Ascobolus immersus RN42]